jgi:hypothetical protein
MPYTFVEKTKRSTYQPGRQATLVSIEVPELQLKAYRHDPYDPIMVVYVGEKHYRTIIVGDTNPKSFRRALRDFVQNHFPGD